MARRVVRRGHKSGVGYFQSQKMDCAIGWESRLERDFLVRCETDIAVTAMHGQPEQVTWRDGLVRRTHFPDFRVVTTGSDELVEVKYLSQVAAIADRTAAIARDLAKTGRMYRVVSEDTIRAEPAFSNACMLLRGMRQEPAPSLRHDVLALLRGEPDGLPIRQVIKRLEQLVSLVNGLYFMILVGDLELAHAHLPITYDSALRVRAVRP